MTPAGHPTPGHPPGSAEELARLAERWQQLPLGQALSYAAGLRELAQHLFDVVAERTGTPTGTVADLGPATALDQLTVAVYEAGRLADPAVEAQVRDALRALRRGIPDRRAQLS